ncbi:MAG: carbonic anhydrase [Candidatus Azotimanducaceae bacterium]|jgi:carbonic anhydrase
MRTLPRLSALMITAMLSAAATADQHGSGWSYSGNTGPDSWGGACTEGSMQSPIDLAYANTVGEIEVSIDYTNVPLNIANLGKTVQANFPAGLHMTTGGKVFNLIQVHFHTPSEHAISGELMPLVAHFVHATDEGALGVLGVMFEEGDANAELQKIIDGAKTAGKEATMVERVELVVADLVPEELDVYRYMGSLTTPPCSEGVNWHVVSDSMTASNRQISQMERLMGMNARPLLPVNNRLVVAPE